MRELYKKRILNKLVKIDRIIINERGDKINSIILIAI